MQKNDFVKISYEGKVKESGQLVDKADDIVIIAGANYIINGLDEEIEKMNIGEKKNVEVLPAKAFGERSAENIKLVPLSEFRKHGQNPYPGMAVEADNMRGRVLSVSSGRVKVDFNHPLAGKVLVFDVEVKEKIEKIEDKITGILYFFTRTDMNKIKVKINGKEAEIIVPPTIHPVMKKKVSDDVIKYCGIERVKFVEEFGKIEEKK